MVGLFYIYLPMSWQIPTQIEQDIIAGKAQYQTHQVGYGGQSVLRVDPNSYIVVFGYDFSPAGNGLTYNKVDDLVDDPNRCPIDMAWFGTQQISFYTGSDFYPFLHNIPVNFTELPTVPTEPDFVRRTWRTQCEPISRQIYITSSKNLAISVGLCLQGTQIQNNATPVTGNTPFGLTYGGAPPVQLNNAELALNLAGTRNFIQPQIPTEIYGFTPISPDNSDQLYWFPDTTFGMIDPMVHIQNVWDPIIADTSNLSIGNYKLCLHFALYTAAIPEQRG
jgi:hypothetical protein